MATDPFAAELDKGLERILAAERIYNQPEYHRHPPRNLSSHKRAIVLLMTVVGMHSLGPADKMKVVDCIHCLEEMMVAWSLGRTSLRQPWI